MSFTGAQGLAFHLSHCGLVLAPVLVEMLQEHFSHQSERRGCGFTQATRWLGTLINRPRGEQDLKDLSGQGPPDSALLWKAALSNFTPESEGEGILRQIMLDVLFPRVHSEPNLAPIAMEKLKIGTCPLAEQFFLEVACNRIRRGGNIHIICSEDSRPLLLEKRGLGDNHSAITLVPSQIFGVRLPAGSLVGVQYEDEIFAHCKPTKNGRGFLIPTARIAEYRYLRLTTLAVSPKDRRRNFSLHFEQQLKNHLFLPESAEIKQLHDFAEAQL